MGWLSDEEDDSDGTSIGGRLGSLAQLLTAGAVLFSVIGFGPVETAITRLGSAASTAPPASAIQIGPGVGLVVLAVAVGVLAIVTVFAVGAWYRLPDSPE